MKTALLLVFSLVLSSCGNGKKENSWKNQNPTICKSALCLPVVPWTITSNAVNFPKNFLLKMMDDFEVDTCKYPTFFKVEKNDEGKMDIKFEYPFIPKKGFPVEIIDRGENCDNNAIFHQEDSVVFGTSEISINGQMRRRVVNIYLNN